VDVGYGGYDDMMGLGGYDVYDGNDWYDRSDGYAGCMMGMMCKMGMLV
jgi:hypothetical protein